MFAQFDSKCPSNVSILMFVVPFESPNVHLSIHTKIVSKDQIHAILHWIIVCVVYFIFKKM